jgi:riboflavin biosynthesis pyrimidine reductase
MTTLKALLGDYPLERAGAPFRRPSDEPRAGATARDAHTPGLETLIVTTEEGERRLRSEHGADLRVSRVRAVAAAGPVPPAAVTSLLHRELGVERILHEGGPRLLGAFLAARLVDELFLTVAPQVAGREDQRRPGLAEGAAFLPENAPWFHLQGVKRAGDHLFLRLSARS